MHTVKLAASACASVFALAAAAAAQDAPSAAQCADGSDDVRCGLIGRISSAAAPTFSDASDEASLLGALADGKSLLKIVFDGRTMFDVESAALRPEAEAAVAAMREALAGDADVVLVTGHADVRGAAGFNQELSERRAEAVASALRRVVSGDVRAVGLGESRPLVNARTPAEHGLNRRVEFIVATDALAPSSAGSRTAGAVATNAEAEPRSAASDAPATASEESDRGFFAAFSPRVEAAYAYFDLDEPEFHAAGGRVGLDIGKYFAVEGEAFWPLNEDFTSTEPADVNVAVQTVRTELRNQFGGYGMLRAPLPLNTEVFARVGYAQIRTTQELRNTAFFTETEGGIAYGAGLRGRFGSSALGWRLGYTRTELAKDPMTTGSAALTLNF